MTVEVGLRVKQSLDTFDLDFQHRFQWPFPGLERSDLVWGLGYRFQRYDSEAGAFALKPSGTDLQLASAFLSNDTTIVEKVLHFIVGSKFEHTTFTGFE